jgi:hypothetical protein
MVIFILFSYLYTILMYFNYYTDTDMSIPTPTRNPSVVDDYTMGELNGLDIPLIMYYDLDEGKQLTCNYLLSCFIFIFDATFKNNAGFASFNENY